MLLLKLFLLTLFLLTLFLLTLMLLFCTRMFDCPVKACLETVPVLPTLGVKDDPLEKVEDLTVFEPRLFTREGVMVVLPVLKFRVLTALPCLAAAVSSRLRVCDIWRNC